ncbi:hypothetical protein PORCAN_464 [Porphyromonas crevioricanis JCM 13913]|nr:hypothetical protein PORCAN_464 [Porphyromonas crevioricanis JCM 13913]
MPKSEVLTFGKGFLFDNANVFDLTQKATKLSQKSLVAFV